ncbi:hypothetical protein Q1695_007766 [Nippostrongylus brasiliensis]|nr:hypothetical protein Q1695_007766 [Nippostrongylus brasiliensis]
MFYILCLLLLLGASTMEATMPCVDRMPAPACKAQKDKGNCKSPYFEMQMKMMCAKTCSNSGPGPPGSQGDREDDGTAATPSDE